MGEKSATPYKSTTSYSKAKTEGKAIKNICKSQGFPL